MTRYVLTKTRFKEGVWEGVISAECDSVPAPEIAVSIDGRAVEGVRVSEIGMAPQWLLEIPVPVEAIGDGVQTILVVDANAEVTLGAFTMIGGDALADDVRAEIALLRAELDMLKRAFRRHCLETM